VSPRWWRRAKAVTASRANVLASVWATMMAAVRSLSASSSRETSMLYVGTVTSTKTGTRRFWMIGLRVVGNPAATVITSSPGLSAARAPHLRALAASLGDVRVERASKLAEEPEFTR